MLKIFVENIFSASEEALKLFDFFNALDVVCCNTLNNTRYLGALPLEYQVFTSRRVGGIQLFSC